MTHRVTVALAVVSLSALAATAGASAARAPVVRVSTPGELSAPRIGIDARGVATFSWLRRSGDVVRVQARRRSADGNLGPVLAVSAPGQSAASAQLAVAPSGHAVVVWIVRRKRRPAIVRARALPATGAPGPPVVVTEAASRDGAQVVVDASGDALLTWTQRTGNAAAVMARRWPRGGAPGPAVDISAATPGTGFNPPSVAIDAGGDALFAWEAGGGGAVRILTRPWPRSAPPGAIATVSAPGVYSQAPQLVLDAGGAGIVAWGASPGGRSATPLHVRRRSAAGKLGPIRDLGIGDHHAGLALGPDGTAYLTGSFDIDPEGEVRAATLSPSGVLATTDPFTSDHEAIQIAALPSGGALLVWSHRGEASVLARSLSAAGELGAPVTVSPPRRRTRQPALALGPGGRPQVAWIGGMAASRIVETAAAP